MLDGFHGERVILQRLLAHFPESRATPGVVVGRGDDAAILQSGPEPSSHWVISCDSALEGTHFLLDLHPADSIGFKALARAASDLAAVGAVPHSFLLALAVPPRRTGSWLSRFAFGLSRAARRLGMRLIGGDLSHSARVFASVTVIGRIWPSRAVLRHGAHPGDRLYVTGTLGQSELGFRILRLHPHSSPKKSLLQRHLFPQPRLRQGRWLADEGVASSMIDTSDGLSRDLQNLCIASHVGARIHLDRLPAVDIPRRIRNALGGRFSSISLALHGGEDYELLFTVPRRFERRLPRTIAGVPLTCIGEITHGRKMRVVTCNGNEEELSEKGWDPFRKR